MQYKLEIEDIKEDYLINLLKQRKIDDIDAFLHPTKENELNPFLLDNMQAGIEMLYKNLSNPIKKIGLVVDPDMDGFTSSAIMYNYIKKICPLQEIEYFLHSGKQHGLEDLVEYISTRAELKMLILPDSSTNDIDFHKMLNEKKIDVLVIDHHEINPSLKDTPNEYACVINNQISDRYENKEITGAGMVYKFCEAYDAQYGYDYAKDFIDLAAMGCIGDMADTLHPETRYIITEGLKTITNPFLQAIIEKQAYSIGSVVTPTAVSFYITPLINALIRVGKDDEKIKMFEAFINGMVIVDSTKRGARPGEMELLTQQAARNCVNAKSRQGRAVDKALDNIKMTISKSGLDDNKIIVAQVEDETIDTNLTGLLAMKLVSFYHRPVLVGRIDNEGNLKGSGRAPGKCSLADFRQYLIDTNLFEYAEGHAAAFGHSLPLNNLEKFIEVSNNDFKDTNFGESVYSVDFVRQANDGDLANLTLEIGQYNALWAKGCEEPYIVVKDIIIKPSDLNIMGATKDTVKFRYNGVDFIKFKDGDFINELMFMKEIKITILGRANLNNFMGNITPQIFIEDYDLVDSYFEF